VSERQAALVALGDRAWRFPLSPSLERRALIASLRALDGVVDVLIAEDLGAVVVGEATAPETVSGPLTVALASVSASASAAVSASLHTIPVAYDGADLPALAHQLGLRTDALIALHAHRDYEVAMVGFMPGFAYLRGLDPRLVVARRDSPRTRVPARSVAIAAEYTGIYPFASPGGWHLLGEAIGFVPFDARGAALAIGDRVRFEPTARASAPVARPPRPLWAAPSGGTWLEVRAARGPALLIDGGRTGHMHEGVPHGGPMVRGALARANAAVGNARGACAVEVYGQLEVIARGGRITVGDDVRGTRTLDEGEAFVIATDGRTRVRYLAVRGGLDVPIVLGGRGTMLVAGIGGIEGRALRRGDRLRAEEHADASADARVDANPPADTSEDAVPVMIGPDAEEGEFEELVRTTFTIAAASDRTGTRLVGPALRTARDATVNRRPTPMVHGAIERTPSGLIVLGPDHPTTGGYPVIGVLPHDALDLFFGSVPGQAIRFVAHT
jgi:KipI family sensor histidine kinase inhibitor